MKALNIVGYTLLGVALIAGVAWAVLTYSDVANFAVATSVVLMHLPIAVAGAVLALLFFLLVSPAFKGSLLHDPNKPGKISLFVQVDTGRTVAIDWGGNFSYQIDSERTDDNGRDVAAGPVGYDEEKGAGDPLARFWPWMLYKRYVWWWLKVHVYLPFLTEPKSYDLPRYEYKEDGGKRRYVAIGANHPKFRSNHVRVAPFTWQFEYSGAEVQTIPYTIKGSAQVMIDPGKVKEALYLTESWNVLLDQALNSVTRSVVRGVVKLDELIGSVEKDLWAPLQPDNPETMYRRVANLIYEELQAYQFEGKDGGKYSGKKLPDLGIIVLRIDITDFEDELSETEREKVRAAILGRQEGRQRALIGKGIADEQSAIVTALEGSELGPLVLNARALVDASKEGSLDSLAASLLRKWEGKPPEARKKEAS